MNRLLRIAITTGDTDGIGSEVTAKALSALGPQKGIQFYLWRSPKTPQGHLDIIDQAFRRIPSAKGKPVLDTEVSQKNEIVDICTESSPAQWVEQMAEAGLQKKIDALVTAPLSKTGMVKAGYQDRGHTDILKRICKVNNVHMTFLGSSFNVVLMTGHSPIDTVYHSIDENLLENCIRLTDEARAWLPAPQSKRPIGLVGCNPHAGENGLIGSKEKDILEPLVEKLTNQGFPISQPLVPDVCFQKRFWTAYSFYIASFHDQGLIPFKMVHGTNSGVQISLGLPFVRTSVDHGTAKDIFGKDQAQFGSMRQALDIACRRVKNETISW